MNDRLTETGRSQDHLPNPCWCDAVFAILFVPYVLILMFVSRANIIVQFPRGRTWFISAGILGYVAAVVIWIK